VAVEVNLVRTPAMLHSVYSIDFDAQWVNEAATFSISTEHTQARSALAIPVVRCLSMPFDVGTFLNPS
jgi:hypothetical protein